MPILSQVFLGENGGYDTDGKELPRLIYVSREKRPKFNHQKKAGALNALVSNTKNKEEEQKLDKALQFYAVIQLTSVKI